LLTLGYLPETIESCPLGLCPLIGLTIEIPKLGKSHNISLNLGARLTGNVWDPSAKLGSVNVGAKVNF